ncbi:MAG: DNA polymerase III subunit [Calditrichaeota bacterium]|nr:DNA polymerase III subunit [Calditrichota bacterium]RQV92719.1 MAG: DNA polymerase III subunit [bacterium]RQW00391.1 MAG: DNA polymerase III subunit [Calditrichota bacterium]
MDILTFKPELGHPDIQQRILKSIKNQRFPHAYLFYGKEGTGKEAFAIEIAKLLNCEKGPLFICDSCAQCIKIGKLEHPDIKFIFPTPSEKQVKPEDIADVLKDKAQNPYKRTAFPGKNTFISINTIRELKYEAKFKLYEGKKKVFIISEADEMRPEASNALLKILEEPPANLMLILITSRIHRILPTIRSRSQLIHFPRLEGDEILRIIRRYSEEQPANLSRVIRLALGNIKLAFDFIEEEVLEKRNQAVEFLRRAVMIEKSHELMNHIQMLTSLKDRRHMVLVLFFLLTWFQDTFHVKIQPDELPDLINSDLESNIRAFVEAYPKANYQNLVAATQSAISALEDARNLNPTLIFSDLSIKLNRNIKNP